MTSLLFRIGTLALLVASTAAERRRCVALSNATDARQQDRRLAHALDTWLTTSCR
jgi:hypothetical protein